ncbi:MAG: hypothetical protein HC780_18165 [Leptolyngbyaceae cyanobacterium CSU_1_3]|nr:hypothetical protein [Leptolyngbyaceae cyanobacterium CSU_1_3]
MFSTVQFENGFFNANIPLLRRKHSAFEIEDLPGLWRIHWQLGNTTVVSTFYTRIDQACLLWGIISSIIFITAQFLPLDWRVQALLWSGLTLLGTVAMISLSQRWKTVEPLNQIVAAWVLLMVGGLVLTDLSVFLSWGQVLAKLCPLWLGLNALGYFYTGLKMRSRAFFLIGLGQLLGVAALPYLESWQFLATGVFMGLSSILMAELQWDSGGVCANHALTDQV